MEKTYTYTARSADNPEQVVTFTFQDEHLFVDVGAPIEQVARGLEAQQAEDENADVQAPIKPWLKPMAIAAVERSTHPFNVADVTADVDEERLLVMAWVRTAGLRLAPVIFKIPRVDNADAAQGFVKQLEARKAKGDALRHLVQC